MTWTELHSNLGEWILSNTRSLLDAFLLPCTVLVVNYAIRSSLFLFDILVRAIIGGILWDTWVDAWSLRHVLLDDITLIIALLGSDLIIVVVPVEQCLNTVSPQEHGVLPYLILIIVLPIGIRILGIKVIFLWWNKGWLHLFIEEIVPVVTLEPHMVLDFLRSIESKTIDRFSLY